MPDTNDWNPRALYDIYRVKLRIRDKICGGMPKNPELLESAVKARTGYDDATTQEQVAKAKEGYPEQEVADEVEKSWNCFPEDKQKGLFIWTRQVKALFKECASMLRLTTEKRGSKQVFQHGFEIKSLNAAEEDRLYLSRTKPDGFDEGPIHVQTAQGPRTAIKRVDFAQHVLLEFEVWVLGTHAAETRHVGEDDLRKMLVFGQENGLGADRSQGRGKFNVVSFERLSKAVLAPKEEKAPTPKGLKKTTPKATAAPADAE